MQLNKLGTLVPGRALAMLAFIRGSVVAVIKLLGCIYCNKNYSF